MNFPHINGDMLSCRFNHHYLYADVKKNHFDNYILLLWVLVFIYCQYNVNKQFRNIVSTLRYHGKYRNNAKLILNKI